MGLFGKIRKGKKEQVFPPFELSKLGADMHSHLIPGIDDGSRSMDESIAMLAKFESLGYKKVITTPHIMGDYFRNTPETILGGLEKVQSTAKELGLSIQMEAAAEYYYDDSLLNRLKNKEQLLTFGDNYVLFEFSFHSKPDQIEKLFFEFLTQGYKPVLAHFERYLYYLGSVDTAAKWREKGVLIQMNINSLCGHYGAEIKQQAEQLVDAGLIDFAGTDCHRIEHLLILEKGLTREYINKLGDLELKNPELI